MLTITRRQAHRLAAVFRRRTLGLPPRGAAPPLEFRPEPGLGLRVRLLQDHPAVECLLPGAGGGEALAVPLELPADVAGPDDTPVALEPLAAGRVAARWRDRIRTRSREYAVPDLEPRPESLPVPPAFASNPAGLLEALAEAAATAGEATPRFGLDHLRLRGPAGEVAATDGRQALIRRGFRFPWDGDRLVPRTPLFACPGLPRDRPVEVGATATHVVLRLGPWTLFLTIRDRVRYPDLDSLLPVEGTAAARLRLDPADAAVLAEELGRHAEGEESPAPVTLDLDGHVAVRARVAGRSRPVEVILGRSRASGEPVRLASGRAYLLRALRLGCSELGVTGPEAPVVGRAGDLTYLWQPLSRDAVLEPAADAVRPEVPAGGTGPEPLADPRETVPVPEPIPRSRPAVARNGSPGGNGPHPSREVAATPGGAEDVPGLTSLIREAESLHEILTEARTRTRRLIAALRRERKRSRLVANTLAALRQIRLPEAVG